MEESDMDKLKTIPLEHFGILTKEPECNQNISHAGLQFELSA